jgi:hypothetical protein
MMLTGKLSLQQLVEESILLAKGLGCDVYSLLDNFDNKTIVEIMDFFCDEENKLLYHIFNFKCPFFPAGS